MKKYLVALFFALSFFVIAPNGAWAAIAFDAASSGGTSSSGTGWTWSHTVTGTNTILLVQLNQNTDDHVSGVTYNSVAMTKLTGVNFGVNPSNVSVWYLINPSTGANTISVSTNQDRSMVGSSVSYTGVSQTGFPDASGSANANGVTTITATLTTVADNAWVILFNSLSEGTDNQTAGAGTTLRRNTGNFGFANVSAIFDNNVAKTPAGSVSLIANWTNSSNYGYIKVSLAPVIVPPQGTRELIQGFQYLIRGVQHLIQ